MSKTTAIQSAPTCAAAQSYREHAEVIADLLDQIRLAGVTHAARASTQPRNWGFAGDLERTAELLRQALDAIGGEA